MVYNFKEIEQKASKVLTKKDINNSVRDDKKRKKLFSFLEGPPTANAPPALHHLEVRTYKDIINKFRYMQGYNVPRKAGWDCHGLPVEVQIEKKIGLNSKKDILKYGESKFINECRTSVFSYIKEWNKSTERLGYLVDLENPYITLENNYIESVWWSLKQLYDKGLLYEAHKVVPFCPRCETPLSSHEVAQGYKKIKEDSVIIKFKLKKKNNEYFLVFTTTPWTLPSNLAIAVNPELTYSYVEENGEIYILAKNLVKNYFENPKIIKEVKGKVFLNEKYEPLFPYFKNLEAFKIIGGSFVLEEEGTGLVHMAPAFGEVDYEACKAEGLPFVQPINENGKFTEEVPEYADRFIKDVDRDIIQRLEDENKLFKIVKYEHDYPFCWRCDTPLMYYAIKSWFIKVTAYKNKLLKLNEKINWVPKHIKEGRFGEWLNNVKDWALSRKKSWGTPLPIWRCECGQDEIIGSVEELKKKSLKKFYNKEMDLHKPWIDNLKIKCKCGKEMKRVPEVIDCWYDSGAASFAQFHYPFENKSEFERRFPYDFISEAIDQTRGWFYTLHVLGTLLFENVTYKNVICAGHIVDEKGEKMSKSKGNILNPDFVMDSVGVDATRLQFCTVDIGSPKRFGLNLVKEEVAPFLNILWNTSQFYEQLDNQDKAEVKVEDKWVLSRLNSIIEETTKNLEDYQIEKGLYPIMNFVLNDFSRTYIKIIRDREDKNVKNVIGQILENISRLLAPYAPNITGVIYQGFSKKSSVHLSDWPKFDKKMIDKKLEEGFNLVKEILTLLLAEREKADLGVRWPLSKAVINSERNLKKFEEVIKSQANVKKIEWNKGKLSVKLDTKLTKELEEEGFARELMRNIQNLRKEAGLEKNDLVKVYVESDYNLSKWKKQISEKVGAKELIFGKPKNQSKFYLEKKIKEKNFVINLFVL